MQNPVPASPRVPVHGHVQRFAKHLRSPAQKTYLLLNMRIPCLVPRATVAPCDAVAPPTQVLATKAA